MTVYQPAPSSTPPRKPPGRPELKTGDVWFVQFDRGCLVLACRVEEVTERTVALWQISDLGSTQATRAYRFKQSEVHFLERVPDTWSAEETYSRGVQSRKYLLMQEMLMEIATFGQGDLTDRAKAILAGNIPEPR